MNLENKNASHLMRDGNFLPISEDFYTLQGEGEYSGKAAYFIRLAGCNVKCAWCDSKNSWDASLFPLISISDIVDKVMQTSTDTVIITGGEPLMHNLDLLCEKLHENKLKIFLETSGSSEYSGSFDWICLSPKKNKHPLQSIYKKASEIKIVISNSQDFQWAEENASKVSNNCMLFLQPEWSQRENIIPIIIEYIKNNPKWRLSIQSHKYINIP